jgi:hypothetical protein
MGLTKHLARSRCLVADDLLFAAIVIICKHCLTYDANLSALAGRRVSVRRIDAMPPRVARIEPGRRGRLWNLPRLRLNIAVLRSRSVRRKAPKFFVGIARRASRESRANAPKRLSR